MNRSQLYLSTIDANAYRNAVQYGLGVEIAEFCMASNMDDDFQRYDCQLRKSMISIQHRLFHAPFSELYPCAIDPKARALALTRFQQASEIAAGYGVERVVFHAGYVPRVYDPCWFVEKSIAFWRDFLKSQPQGRRFCLENVMESDPLWLKEIVIGVGDPRLGICLDIGHANVYSKIDAVGWMESLAPWIAHVHIHNNDGTQDSHAGLCHGSIPITHVLQEADALCKGATFTLEITKGEPEILWLLENNILEV